MPSFDFPVAEIQHCQLNSCRVSWTQLLHLPTGPFWLHASSCCVMMSVSITVSLISLLGTRVSIMNAEDLLVFWKFTSKSSAGRPPVLLFGNPLMRSSFVCVTTFILRRLLMNLLWVRSEDCPLSPVTFFTDGSCHFPHHKTSRFAALMSLLPMTNVEIWPNSSNLLDAFPIPYKSLQWHAPQVHTSFGTLCNLENLGMVW